MVVRAAPPVRHTIDAEHARQPEAEEDHAALQHSLTGAAAAHSADQSTLSRAWSQAKYLAAQRKSQHELQAALRRVNPADDSTHSRGRSSRSPHEHDKRRRQKRRRSASLPPFEESPGTSETL